MRRSVVPAAALLVLLLAGPLAAQEFTESFTLDLASLHVIDLIGEVRVLPAAGDAFEVEVAVKGVDARRDRLDIVVDEDERTLRVDFPLDKERDYVYPPLKNGKTSIQFDQRDEGNHDFWEAVSMLLGSERVTVRGKGRGLQLWADVTVRVPAGREADVRLGVGRIEAEGVRGDLVLDISSGSVAARGIVGSVLADTGSGSVEFLDIDGDATADTGSGEVVMRRCRGEEIKADTGSGGVTLEDVACERLVADTGSGGVQAEAVDAGSALIDTGSGSVLLQLTRMGGGRFVVDTGSGGVELVLPRDASCRVTAETGSGGVHVDVPGVAAPGRHTDELEFTVGGGEAQVTLDTGSGGIRVRMQ
ncbi:MAG: DUF4097 family beta strand repeat-containing protein [bacterium]|nr:DUF4097 family beta strand repeat-containing protein [bacterium]